MAALQELLDSNKRWARNIEEEHPEFFHQLAQQQKPRYLWIGCADSRVPANEIVGLLPGEMFVHRNVANLVVHTDFNCLSVLQFAVDVLKVEHVIVTGHYGCGGMRAALDGEVHGLIDNWLRYVKDVHHRYAGMLNPIVDMNAKADRLSELNVIEQVVNVCETTILEDAWRHGQQVTVHGWIYGLHDGLLRDLSLHISHPEEIETRRAKAVNLLLE